MTRVFLLITCVGALLLSACGGDSNLPTPTGDGAVRAINAIPDSPDVFFLIEERVLGTAIQYQGSSAPSSWNDFNYDFNFEIFYPGNTTSTRIATQSHKVEKDRDHIFLLTGDINAPTVTVWNGDIREWEGNETVLEARFSHASASLQALGDIDIYFDEAGTALGTNPPVATLGFGEIGDAIDFEEGAYVLTVTAAGDLNTVHFISSETNYLPVFAHVFTLFDGDGNDTAPRIIRSMTSVGNPLRLADARFPPQTRFIHSAFTLETVDIYKDDLLTNQIAADVQFGNATADIDTITGAESYYFTPAGSQATILFETTRSSTQLAGSYSQVYLIGDTDAWVGRSIAPDRASSSIGTKLRIFHASLNQDAFDLYLKDRGEPVAEDDPRVATAAYTFSTPVLQLAEGSYDIYLTEQGTKTELAGPYEIDAVLGDVIDLVAVDTVDPAIIQLFDVSVP